MGGAAGWVPPRHPGSLLPLSGCALFPPLLGPFRLLLLSPPPCLSLSLSFSSRFHLWKNSLQLSRNLLLSALPTGSTVLGSVFLWEGRRGLGRGGGLVRSGREEATASWLELRVLGSQSLSVLSCMSLATPWGQVLRAPAPILMSQPYGRPGRGHPEPASSDLASPVPTACNPGACRAVGRGLQPKGVRVKETADFKVYTKGAGSGELKVTVKGPSKLACG